MSSQLERWQGQFGKEYTDRNHVDWRTRVETFRRLLAPPGPNPTSILEVGCNRGHNLRALEEAAGLAHLPATDPWWERSTMRIPIICGTEPNEYAREFARRDGHEVFDHDIYNVPPNSAALVFTCGVLEHVPPDWLDEALRTMHAASRRWLLAIEYYADKDTAIKYRGLEGMLWKRDYGQHYQDRFPDLLLIDTGDLGPEFDDARYWLLEKP